MDPVLVGAIVLLATLGGLAAILHPSTPPGLRKVGWLVLAGGLSALGALILSRTDGRARTPGTVKRDPPLRRAQGWALEQAAEVEIEVKERRQEARGKRVQHEARLQHLRRMTPGSPERREAVEKLMGWRE